MTNHHIDDYALIGDRRNIGLLNEEWDPRLKQQVDNCPRACSHLTLVGTALRLGDLPALLHAREARVAVREQVLAS